METTHCTLAPSTGFASLRSRIVKVTVSRCDTAHWHGPKRSKAHSLKGWSPRSAASRPPPVEPMIRELGEKDQTFMGDCGNGSFSPSTPRSP